MGQWSSWWFGGQQCTHGWEWIVYCQLLTTSDFKFLDSQAKVWTEDTSCNRITVGKLEFYSCTVDSEHLQECLEVQLCCTKARKSWCCRVQLQWNTWVYQGYLDCAMIPIIVYHINSSVFICLFGYQGKKWVLEKLIVYSYTLISM